MVRVRAHPTFVPLVLAPELAISFDDAPNPEGRLGCSRTSREDTLRTPVFSHRSESTLARFRLRSVFVRFAIDPSSSHSPTRLLYVSLCWITPASRSLRSQSRQAPIPLLAPCLLSGLVLILWVIALGLRCTFAHRFHDPAGESVFANSSSVGAFSQWSTRSHSGTSTPIHTPVLPPEQDPNTIRVETSSGTIYLPALITPRFAQGKRIRYAIWEYANLIDSSEIEPSDWIKIASDIERNYHSFDGFIILHGTDTLAFSASALSFMLVRTLKDSSCVLADHISCTGRPWVRSLRERNDNGVQLTPSFAARPSS